MDDVTFFMKHGLILTTVDLLMLLDETCHYAAFRWALGEAVRGREGNFARGVGGEGTLGRGGEVRTVSMVKDHVEELCE